MLTFLKTSLAKPHQNERYGCTRVIRNHIFWLLPLSLFAQAPVQQSGQGTSSAVQFPLSGRTGQSGSVNTNQSTVNAGGANSVNLINSSVDVQGPYRGSIPTGANTGTPIPITLDYALKQGLQY
ncbi:MAG: hypothetical protein M3Z09_10815, partial [Acidobacteriota bacterium]|nr:hypothetical protein [Acidobacteriota bacterium]